MAGKHRLVKIYRGMSKKTKAGIISGLLVAGVAGGMASASAASAPQLAAPTGVTVSNITSTGFEVIVSGAKAATKEQVVVWASGTVQGAEFDKVVPAGNVAVSGLKPGTAYSVKVSLQAPNHTASHFTSDPGVVVTTAASGSDGAAGGPQTINFASESGNAALSHVGGSWSTGHVAVKSVDLKAGTYLVELTGDFYKTATTTATPDLQIQLNGADKQLTAYTDAFPYNAGEAFGVGSDGSPNGLELTAHTAGVITLTKDTTVEIDAFGYNADRGSEGGGDFGVNATADFVTLAS